MKRKLLTIGILCCLCIGAQAQVKKSDVSVLYVGGSADMDAIGEKVDSAELRKSVAERTASFEKMLKHYFKTVKAVQGADYEMGMSENYDVTIFDGKPKELTPAKLVQDEQGNPVDYTPATYLTEDFDRPAIVVAEMGSTLGSSIGLKTDWYCLCLDAHAHHFRAEHPIFHRPFPVEMTVEMRPTPEGAYEYAYYHEGAIPDSLPMWRVQTKGYMTDKGFRHRRIGVGPAGQHQGAVTQHGRTAVHIKPLAQQKADHLRVPVMLGRQQKRIVPQSGVAPRQNLSGVGPGLHQGFQNGRIRAECRSPQKGGKAIGHGGIRLASGL